MEFQLSKYYDGESIHDVKNTWAKVTGDLLAESNFGKEIQPDNFDESKDLSAIGDNENNDLNKARAIYYFVQNNFTCASHYHVFITTSLKDVIKKKSGGIGEINLLLVAMLRKKEIHADPVLLSTREFGTNFSQYPILERLNYVICRAIINGVIYYLDASRPFLGFGAIPQDCYNGHARVICQSDSVSVYFSPDSLKEKKITTVFIMNDEKASGSMSGTFSSTLGNVESYNLREQVSDEKQQDYFKSYKSNSDYTITNAAIDSLTQLDMPATVHYDFAYKISSDNDIIYFNPMFSEGYKENPFKSAERKYPVEMPYVMDETYVFNMEIPNGYVVDEMPKSAKVSLNGTEGSFEYLIAKDDASIQMRSRIKLNKATFEPDDYSTLRDFFAAIVKKQSEQIVFKKKK
ncbi:MAG TPA: DUF3858 domain-containing protein [Puia sp.]|nr:DUF3858 domain-containing protein [Puia sp.]